MGDLETSSDRAQLRLRSDGRDAGLEARDAREIAAGAGAIVNGRIESHWGPEIGLAALDAEAVRHHADDRERPSVETHALPQRVVSPAELPLPESMADDGHGRRSEERRVGKECR